jgi:putative ABC transport system permease protein
VTSYSAVQRTREMGLRMALGADRTNVLKLAMKRGLAPLSVGLLIGLAGAFALTRVLRSFLYGVTPTDPMTFVAGCFLFLVVGLIACYVPARKASRIDPMAALRYE